MAERMTTRQVLDEIARERTRLMAAIDATGAGASTLPVTDEGWTAKDVLAHLIHWATQVAYGLGRGRAAPGIWSPSACAVRLPDFPTRCRPAKSRTHSPSPTFATFRSPTCGLSSSGSRR
ncbi:MAG: maleylpyruvate isomerase N-terminal domain-containing protein [Dehalococcoidia bacterium]